MLSLKRGGGYINKVHYRIYMHVYVMYTWMYSCNHTHTHKLEGGAEEGGRRQNKSHFCTFRTSSGIVTREEVLVGSLGNERYQGLRCPTCR